MCLPALLTVRAVFPHTALRSVVSSSGISLRLPGGTQGEQPGSGEEDIGPALMFGLTATTTLAFGLLAPHGAQRSAMSTYWVPGVNNLKAYGRWAFAEFTDVYMIEADFAAKIESEFDRMIQNAVEQKA